MYNLRDGLFRRHEPKLVADQHAKELELTWIHKNEIILIMHKKILEEGSRY